MNGRDHGNNNGTLYAILGVALLTLLLVVLHVADVL